MHPNWIASNQAWIDLENEVEMSSWKVFAERLDSEWLRIDLGIAGEWKMKRWLIIGVPPHCSARLLG